MTNFTNPEPASATHSLLKIGELSVGLNSLVFAYELRCCGLDPIPSASLHRYWKFFTIIAV